MIKENILKMKERISFACSKIKESPDNITIVAVCKGRALSQIKEVINAGVTDIGENKVQEAIIKYKELKESNSGLRTHMVGHLQANKAKDAVKIFDLIQSVDSLRLAEEIDRQAVKINKVQDILIQVNTSGEPTKFGLKPDETVDFISRINKFKNIKIKGLMTIAPVVDDSEKTRPYFRLLRELRDKINTLTDNDYQLTTLSMGMTDDFQAAIEEGSNMVRLGRAIFG